MFTRKVFFLVLVFSLTFCGASYAKSKDAFTEMIGTWNMTSVRTMGKVKATYKGKAKYWKLPDGTYRSRAWGKMGKINLVSEKWIYMDGTTQGYSYANGELNEISKGTWKVNGNQTDITETFDSLGLSVIATGYSRRINRNRYIGFFTIDSLGIRQTSTMVRIGK